MATLYILSDHSSSAGWLFTALSSNQALLANHNIALAQPDRAARDILPQSNYFFYLLGSDPDYGDTGKKLDTITALLEQGTDVLLPARLFDNKNSEKSYQFLKERFAGKHDLRLLIRFDNPVLTLERWHRITKPEARAESAEHFFSLAANTSAHLRTGGAVLGPGHVTWLFDAGSSLSRESARKALDQTLQALGIAEKATLPPPLPDYSFLNTWTGVRLLDASQVRHNDWPRLDTSAFMEALQKVEAAWGPEAVVPLEERKRFLEAAKADRAAIADLFAIAPEALEPPEWVTSLPGLPPDAPLDGVKAGEFAAALPGEARRVLLQRYANDAEFLTEDQKVLQNALQREEGFCHIGSVQEQPLLTVLTMTRNQENYIGACIESVLAQKTDFPVQHLVLDHYSDDGTPQIVEKYANAHSAIRPVLLHNYHNIYSNVRDLFLRGRSEYVALCDGDDYFTDPLKLQKQMDFLRANRDCSVCFHPVLVHFDSGEREDFVYPPPEALPRGVRKKYYLADLMTYNFIQTNSAVYRWRFRDGLPDWFESEICPGDWYWHLLHAERGNIGFIPEVMSVYRRHSAASYNHAFLDVVAHRRATGMAELKVYDIVNRHFQGRYQQKLSRLAASVFDAYMQIYATEGSSALLDEACEKFPVFGGFYLAQVNEELRKKTGRGDQK